MTIIDMITDKYKCMVWKDEQKNPFLLTKHAEIFMYNKNILGVWLWNKAKLKELEELAEVLKGIQTGPVDRLYITYMKAKDLNKVLDKWGFKRRPHQCGKWLLNKFNILGHAIIRFSPQLSK